MAIERTCEDADPPICCALSNNVGPFGLSVRISVYPQEERDMLIFGLKRQAEGADQAEGVLPR